MKILHTLLFTSIIVVCAMSGCGDDKILAALDGKKKQKEGDLVPFILHQNYPNPFNPTTSIRFNLYDNMRVSLRVYTEDWHEVAIIVDQELQGYFILGGEIHVGAYYEFTFNAEKFASGVYYYVLEGGRYKQIRKMRLLK